MEYLVQVWECNQWVTWSVFRTKAEAIGCKRGIASMGKRVRIEQRKAVGSWTRK